MINRTLVIMHTQMHECVTLCNSLSLLRKPRVHV